MKNNKTVTRRDFIGRTTTITATAYAGLTGAAAYAEKEERAKVVMIRHPEAIDDKGKVNAAVLEKMLDDAVVKLFSAPSPADAWRQIINPDDTVGVKSNVWRFLPTPKELEDALVQRVKDVGVKPDNIAVDDRSVRSNPVFKKATALINARPMRTHHWAGVGSCIKNYIVFHPKPYTWHDDACANLAGIWDMPEVKGKTRLNVLVMLTPLFHGKGPHHFQSSYTWAYNGLLVGTDPVAVDATGLRIIQAKRQQHFGEEAPLVVSPKHIQVAQDKYTLGIADNKRIDVISLGWQEERLI